ncbi:GspE/PulE family protein [Vibrio sp. SS-MA-C1-2]|uniref:GspE/PulE family protein n=1 Tax=Vibrio sp. SS-MA-C1-2 TaxID=2908646 RepID=UPI001F1FFD43|nr:GspE/PulE family protein [Vibrio sp. SS-MA-C1-2]UJF19623.1 GspE/PulE family protein [Vibrio sp. SS-MA-C1-2]
MTPHNYRENEGLLLERLYMDRKLAATDYHQILKERKDQSNKENERNLSLIDRLYQIKEIEQETLFQQLIDYYQLEEITFSQQPLIPAPMEIVSIIEALKLLPLNLNDNQIDLLTYDPTICHQAHLLISFILQRRTKIYLVRYSDYLIWQQGYQQQNQTLSSSSTSESFAVLEQLIESHPNKNQMESDIEDDSSPIAKIVTELILKALSSKASDIHFEAQHNGLLIRQRIDGVLTQLSHLPQHYIKPVISRIKIVSQLDISERRHPQDGRFQLNYQQKKCDIRVAILPTIYGEKAVLRLLNTDNTLLTIEHLGLTPLQEKVFIHNLNQQQGLILVTGPTGSGKTQTLYAALQCLNNDNVNISTAEDPVEIRLPGLNQVQINPAISFDFSDALKTFLRQDPDIIMIGEIRDFETADIAMKAAQTGHLVLSTLHTNSAYQTILRLENIGVQRFNIAATVRLIIAQRLVRKLCIHCRINMKNNIYRANLPGCPYCQKGYKGRHGIFELLPVTPQLIENLSDTHIKPPSLNKPSRPRTILESSEMIEESSGFIPLRQQAQELVFKGITDQQEICRVLGQ